VKVELAFETFSCRPLTAHLPIFYFHSPDNIQHKKNFNPSHIDGTQQGG